MNPSGNRSVYFDHAEHAELERVAEEEQTSVSAIVRAGVRILLGMPAPRWARMLHEERETK